MIPKKKQRVLDGQAFTYYYSLGPGRSYQAVAEHYKATKRAVVKRAVAEGWQEKLAVLNTEAAEKVAKAIMEDDASFRLRSLRDLQQVQERCVLYLQSAEFDSAKDATRALEACIKMTLLLRGCPEKTAHLTIEYVRELREFEAKLTQDRDRTMKEHFREIAREVR